MTGTPDALIRALEIPTVATWTDDPRAQHEAIMAATSKAREALRARLTAGDAAIKRVAELERDERDHIETQYNVGVALGWPKKEDGVPDTAWDDKPKLSVAVAKVVADLAAARAEIEQLRGIVSHIRSYNDNPAHFDAYIDKVCATALAPKE